MKEIPEKIKPIEAMAGHFLLSRLSRSSWRPKEGVDVAQMYRDLDAYLASHEGSGHRTSMLTAFRNHLRTLLPAPAAAPQLVEPTPGDAAVSQSVIAIEHSPEVAGAMETIVALGGLDSEALEAEASPAQSPFEPPAQPVPAAEDHPAPIEDADAFLTVLMGNESPTQPPSANDIVGQPAEESAAPYEVLDADVEEVRPEPPPLPDFMEEEAASAVAESWAAEEVALDPAVLAILDETESHVLPPVLGLGEDGTQNWEPPFKEATKDTADE
jgi:hypothetical protein